jgi:hypothetical protein
MKRMSVATIALSAIAGLAFCVTGLPLGGMSDDWQFGLLLVTILGSLPALAFSVLSAVREERWANRSAMAVCAVVSLAVIACGGHFVWWVFASRWP